MGVGTMGKGESKNKAKIVTNGRAGGTVFRRMHTVKNSNKSRAMIMVLRGDHVLK